MFGKFNGNLVGRVSYSSLQHCPFRPRMRVCRTLWKWSYVGRNIALTMWSEIIDKVFFRIYFTRFILVFSSLAPIFLQHDLTLLTLFLSILLFFVVVGISFCCLHFFRDKSRNHLRFLAEVNVDAERSMHNWCC